VITANQRNEIVHLYNQGVPKRRIARQLGIARNTVVAVIAKHLKVREEPAPFAGLQAAKRRPSQLDSHEAKIRSLLDAHPKLTAVRVLEEIRREGFVGGYSIVKALVAALRPRPAQPLVERFETPPGQQGQMDHSPYDIPFLNEGRRRVYAFSMVLGFCRKQYLSFVESQDFYTTIQHHVKAFEHLGGVPREILYDNFKVVVVRIEDEEPIYNVRFLAFATHYGFRPRACRRRRPQTKGKVERPFHYVETNLLNGRDFRTCDHLNETAAWWLREIADVRIHRETKRRPIDMHREELAHLLPLPQARYDTAEVAYRSVNEEGRVPFRGNHYSVPWQRVGELAVVRATEAELIVYGRDIQEIARHTLLPRTTTGQVAVDPSHLPRRDRHHEREQLAARFAELGDGGTRFLDGLLHSQTYGKHQACRILGLMAVYRRNDLVKALERAGRYRAHSFAAVERILSVEARPKKAIETMAETARKQIDDRLREPAVPARTAADYQQLISGPQPAEDRPDDGEGNHGTSQG
jgi:transposase